MKKLVFMLMPVTLLTACVKQNTPTNPIDERVDTTVNMQARLGMFINGPYGTVSGNAKIYTTNNIHTLALENVTISNGPDLHVYISKELLPVNYIDLGKLQSISGNQLYQIPGNPDFSQYKYALIHCQRYNHLFGSAELR
jgi:hypothetical protein